MPTKPLNLERRTMADRYTKVVLTIIAVALTALAIQPYTLPPQAIAAKGGIVDVRIRDIDKAPHAHWEAINVHRENSRSDSTR